jgi:molybdate transport system substrate-binding protein
MIIHRTTSGQRGTGHNIPTGILIACLGPLLTIGVFGCGLVKQPDDEVIVFAAASVQGAVQEVADNFQAEHGITVRLNFAASGVLAQQIMVGGRADVFISASEAWADEISAKGLANAESTTPLMSNSLVIVAHQSTDWQLDSIEQLSDLPFRNLLVGDPAFVPAGKYAQQFFQSSVNPATERSIWESLEDRICPTSDLRRVLALVEADRSLAGFVYATDAASSDAVKVIYQVPRSEVLAHYFLVRLKSSSQAANGERNADLFLDYLFRESSSKIFDRFGFGEPAE